jgi:sulfite exporter TauE/SafE
MEIWTAFVLGLVGSMHCAGMCGPLALALPRATGPASRFVAGRVAYNMGRIATYCTLGVVFGILGRSLALAGIQRWVSIALGLLLLAGLLSSSSLAHWVPVTTLVNVLKSRMSRLLKHRSVLSLAILGLLNGLLPCGLVYVACAGATVSGGVGNGLSYMAAFGAGTVPMMMAVSLSGNLMPPALRLRLLKALPIAVILLATLLILRGMSLGIPYLSPDLSAGGLCCQK